MIRSAEPWHKTKSLKDYDCNCTCGCLFIVYKRVQKRTYRVIIYTAQWMLNDCCQNSEFIWRQSQNIFDSFGCEKTILKCLEKWSVSNFIPMDFKKFGLRNFDCIIRFGIENDSEIEKMRSRDRRIFEKNRFYQIGTLV